MKNLKKMRMKRRMKNDVERERKRKGKKGKRMVENRRKKNTKEPCT